MADIGSIVVKRGKASAVRIRDGPRWVLGHELSTGAPPKTARRWCWGTVFMLIGENSREGRAVDESAPRRSTNARLRA